MAVSAEAIIRRKRVAHGFDLIYREIVASIVDNGRIAEALALFHPGSGDTWHAEAQAIAVSLRAGTAQAAADLLTFRNEHGCYERDEPYCAQCGLRVMDKYGLDFSRNNDG